MLDYLVVFCTFALGAYTIYSDRKYNEKKRPKQVQYIKYALLLLVLVFGSVELYQGRLDTSTWHQGDILGSELETPVLKIGTANMIPAGDLETLFKMVDDPIEVWIYDREF